MEEILQTRINLCKIMRITLSQIVAMLILTGISRAEISKAQSPLERDVTLSIENVSLNKALERLEKSVSVRFVYSKNFIPLKHEVSILAEHEKLESVLNKLLTPLNIKYEVIKDRIVLNKIKEVKPSEDDLADESPESISEQWEEAETTVNGTVTDETGSGIPGVNVLLKGTAQGTTTDAAGKYMLTVSDGNNILVFSFIGYATQEVAINNQSTVDVVLAADVRSLEEVVVVGYGEQKKETVTGSVATVKGTELSKSPTVNLSNSLAGRMPGVIAIQASGEPGYDGSTIRIRGSNTLGNNNALVVIDGIPDRAGGLERINPADVESISVLKDASAAIYGARAANGVILITTKRGKSGVPQLSYDFNTGWSQPTRVPKMSNAVQYAELMNELKIWELPVDQWSTAQAAFNQTGTYTRTDNGSLVEASFKPADLQKFREGTDPWTHPNTDWFGSALKTWSPQVRHNLQLTGGSENIKYLASLGYQNQDGYYKNSATGYKQYDLRLNLDAKVNKYISTSIGLTGRQENRFFPTRSAGAIFRMLMRGKPTEQAIWPNGLPGPDIENGEQPVVITTNETGYDRDTRYYIQTNGKVDITIPGVEGLKITGTAAVDKFIKRQKRWETPWSLYSWNGSDYESDGVTPQLTKSVRSTFTDPRLWQRDEDQLNVLLGGIISYERTIGDHMINTLVGINREIIESDNFEASRRYFISPAIDQMFAGGSAEINNNGGAFERARLSYFGRVAYNYQQKYMAEFVWRYDGSYMFPEDTRFGFFPGVLVGWNISEENFWKNNIDFINYFKLRGSWGQMGNDQIVFNNVLQEYAYLSTYGFGRYVINNQETKTLYETRVPNPSFTWEVANNSNIGLEAALLNGALSFEFDVFYNKRTNIFIQRRGSTPQTTGFTLPPVNAGEVENRGFEFKIGYYGEVGELKYNVGINGGYAKNKILYWDENPGAPEWQRSTGRPMGTDLLVYEYDGVFRDAEAIANNELDYSEIVGTLRPGDMKYKDVNNDGKITGDDRVRLDESRDPTFSGGVSIGLQFKNFDLSVLFQTATGGVLWIGTESGNIGNYLEYTYNNRWSVENPSAVDPRISNRGDTYYTRDANTYYIRSSDYIRLKNLELGYNLPAEIGSKVGLTNFRVYVNGLNLVTWDKMKIWDPESTSGNGQYYPQARIISVGARVTF